VNVTEDRQSAAEQIVQMFATFPSTMFSNVPTSVEEVLNSPHFLVGTLEQIAEELQARRERYGISYITVPDFMGNVDTLSPLVARLAGT
jgi:hypothetical protein